MRVGPALRAYGEARGLSPRDWAALAPQCPFETADFADGTLTIEHEGHYLDEEPFLEALAKVLPESGEAHLDVIDNEAWTITRHVWKPTGWASQTFGLDDILENTKGEGNL